jgi:allantoicase
MSTFNTSNGNNLSNNSQNFVNNFTPKKIKINLTKKIMKNNILNNILEKSSQTNTINVSNNEESKNKTNIQIQNNFNNKNNNNDNDNNNNIYLTNIFKLPEIKTRNYNQSFIFPNNKKLLKSYEKNLSLLNDDNNLINKSLSLNKSKQNKKFGNLENYMKEKFYFDVDKNVKNKFKKKNWFSESNTQEHLIHMKKVVTFWNGICDYTIPKFSVQKFKETKKLLEQKKKDKVSIKIDTKEEEKKLPILFTNSIVNNLNHIKKIYNENLFYKELKEEYEN